MERPLTLPERPPDNPALDYAALRAEGIRHLERLAGHLWTDHNTHDPGITILEQLCYVLTDLAYRITFDVPDLLASAGAASLFSPAQILPSRAVTLTDFRKIALDVPGVRNAWVEPVEAPKPPVYYDPSDQTLYLEAASHRRLVPLRGLYRVDLVSNTTVSDDKLIDAVHRRLLADRPLCEDFERPRVLKLEPITVHSDVEIGPVEDPEQLLAEIYHALARFLAPSIRFYTLAEMLQRGRRIDEVMEGPRLRRGFIDTDELEGFTRRTTVRVSDLIQVIMDVPGVRAVDSLRLTTPSGKSADWFLELDPDKTPVLESPSRQSPSIRLLRGRVTARVKAPRVGDLFKTLRDADHALLQLDTARDLPIPQGRNRQVGRYRSIQHDFPAVYGIGPGELPADASPRRKAQAAQLKAYLLFYDQILANYFAHLAHLPNLFSFYPDSDGSPDRSYFAQLLDDPSLGLDDLRMGDGVDYAKTLAAITEAPSYPETKDGDKMPEAARQRAQEAARQRRHRFLNHLLARFAEQFTDYALLRFADEDSSDTLLAAKRVFLQQYEEIGSGRGQGIDYTRRSWGQNDNVAGLAKRISLKLGIADYKPDTLCDLKRGGKEGFHLIEHLLLRPRPADLAQWQQAEHALGQTKALLADTRRIDPYSAQISFLFPGWIGRFTQPDFRAFVRKTVREETPAHLSVHVHWLDEKDMERFETFYKTWLDTLTEE